MLMTRAAAIHTAKVQRIRKLLSEVKQRIPTECYAERVNRYPGRHVYAEIVVAERLDFERKSARQQGLAVWAEAELITPEILNQIPICLRKVSLMWCETQSRLVCLMI